MKTGEMVEFGGFRVGAECALGKFTMFSSPWRIQGRSTVYSQHADCMTEVIVASGNVFGTAYGSPRGRDGDDDWPNRRDR